MAPNHYGSINKYGFDRNGINSYGYDERGFNIEDNPRGEEGTFGKKGNHFLTGTDRDPQGYDIRGINIRNFYKYSDTNLITGTKYDEKGYDKRGFNVEGIHMETQDIYDVEGYDINGYNESGYNREGFNKEGYDVEGYDKNGFDCLGINRRGINIETGERDERLTFAEEFLGSDKSIEQFALMKELPVEEVDAKIQEIRKSPYYAKEIDKALKRNADRYVATIKTLGKQLVEGKISIKEIGGIEKVIDMAEESDKQQIFRILIDCIASHDITIIDYAKIFAIKGINKNLPQNIITKLNEINNSVKYSPDRTIKTKMKDIFKEISRVKAYVAPYIPSEGEKIGFIKPGEKDVTMYDITDEERDIARQYLMATNEFVCNKTMQEKFKLVVTGEINREVINELTQNSKSARSLAKAVAKDVTVSEAMQGQEFLDLITNEKQIEGDGKI